MVRQREARVALVSSIWEEGRSGGWLKDETRGEVKREQATHLELSRYNPLFAQTLDRDPLSTESNLFL